MRIVYFIILFTFTFKISKNQGLTNSLNNLSHENLLDNPWFTVNQRSFASTSSALGYTVDRWRVAYNPALNTCELTSNGMVLNSVSKILILQQRFDEEQFKSVVGKMATFSVLLSDGTMYKGSAIFPQKGDASDAVPINNADLYVYYQYNSNSDNLPSVGIYPKVGKTVTIKALKLELGSISTLAMDSAPNYAEELLKCQRYFVRFSTNNTARLAFHGFFSVIDSIDTTKRDVWMAAMLPVVMRATPYVSSNDITKWFFSTSHNGNQLVKFLITLNVERINGNSIFIVATVDNSNTEFGTYGQLWCDTANCYLDLSADL